MSIDEAEFKEKVTKLALMIKSGELELPVYAIHVWGDGNMFCYRLSDEAGKFTQIEIFKHLRELDEELYAPMNVMYVDANGRAAHVVIRETDDESEPTILH